MRLKYILKAIFIPILLMFTAGCSDATEPDTLGYVVAIGIDKPNGDTKGYDITLQFANPSKISGSGEEGGKGGQESIENITVTAPSLYSAVNIANHIISKTFVLSHTKLIVFSRDICRDGVGDLLETVGRSSDIRPNTYFAMSECRAQEFLEAVNPETEINPVRYYTMIFDSDYSGFVPRNMSQDFYFHYRSSEKCPVMPLCSVSAKSGTYKYTDTGYQEGIPDYTAGEISSEKTEAQVMGMAIFNGDKNVGEIRDIQTEIYNILTGDYKTGYVSYFFSQTPDNAVTVNQQQKKRPKIKVDTSGIAPKINITVNLEAEFSSTTPKEAIEDHLDDFTREVTGEIKDETYKFLEMTRLLGTDIVGFGSYAKRNFKTISEFENYNWKEKYKSAEFDVTVNFAVRRTGLIVRSDEE